MKIKTVLISGVAGFIGSNLLDHLLEETDWEITGVDNLVTGNIKNIDLHKSNARFNFIEQDCLQISSVNTYDCIFHLSALPRIQPSFELVNEHILANLVSGIHLIELMIKEDHYPRFVYSGSSAIYGTPEQLPTDENSPIDCLSPYAFQKYEFERYLELISTRFPLDYVILRYFNVYGPRSYNPQNKFNAYSSVVGIFLERKKEKVELQITGDGSQKRDFVHVKDVAEANYLAATHTEKLNMAFNIGYGETISILDLAKLISSEYEFIPKREGEADVTFADISKAKSILGWEPKKALETYITEQIDVLTNA